MSVIALVSQEREKQQNELLSFASQTGRKSNNGKKYTRNKENLIFI